LKYKMLDGHIAFGALSADRSTWLGQTADAPPAGRENVMEYLVDLRKGQKVWLLTTNNRQQGSSPSAVVLMELRAFLYAKGAPSTF
jgi:hypothetical protein